MIKQVIKRDGRIVKFDGTLIKKAIASACKAVNEPQPMLTIAAIVKEVRSAGKKQSSVEDIQVLVENALMKHGMSDVARAYIVYRHKRDIARKSESNEVISGIIAAKANDITRENANMNADTPAGMMMKIASERAKEYASDFLLSDDTRQLKDDNIIHIHDLDHFPSKSLTCVQSPIDKVVSGGFKAGHGESRPAKRIETASILAAISLETTQNEQHGGQAIPAFDFYMAPYVRKTYIEELKKIEEIENIDLSAYYNDSIEDYTVGVLYGLEGERRFQQHAINQTVHRVHQSMEAFIHNMNQIHSRGGNQVVFSSINYGTDTSAEGRCIIRELLSTTYRGVGNGSTAIFPIQIWKKKRGVNYLPEDRNYDLYQYACKVTAKRFFPNFLNLDATFNQNKLWNENDPKRYEKEVATMGCVDGEEIVTYKYKGLVYIEPFKIMWKRLSNDFDILDSRNVGYSDGKYMDLQNVEIRDRNEFVNCSRIINNPDKGDWMKITLSNGRVLTCTSNHPWSVIDKGVKHSSELNIGDCIELVDTEYKSCSENNKLSDAPTDLLNEMASIKKKNHAISFFKPIYFDIGAVSKIENLGYRGEHSYDVTTATEHFNVSGIRSHNCRTRVFENRFGEKTSIARGNLSFTTINLPGLALSVRNIDDKAKRIATFFEKFDYAIAIAGKQLYERYQFQCTALTKQFPLLMSGIWKDSEKLKPTDEVREVLKHGTLGVGFIGLAECLIALIGKHHGESDEAQELGIKIISHMREKITELANHYNLNYSVLATPAEGLSGHFIKKDKTKYGIIPGVTDKDYYTNSNHIPVYYHCSATHKAKVEAPYHEMTRGGHIFYVEIDGDATHNGKAIMDIVGLMDKYNIGYGSINHNRNRCLDCGYEDAAKDLKKCPKCGGENIDTLQRITGYLVGTTDRWNSAKQAELKDRVTHD